MNIFIRDVNDNAPLARIRPVGNMAKPTASRHHITKKNETLKLTEPNSLTNLYIDENASINQILAYVGVFDPDAGENGTIRSIDLTLVDMRKPSDERLGERKLKLNRLKLAGVDEQLAQQLESELDALERINFGNRNQQNIPIKLTKIADKLFTLQLSRKLNFNQFESFSIEMKIRDNGTRPQLESKTLIALNVLNNNKYPPMFLNSRQAELVIQEGYNITLAIPRWAKVNENNF